MEKIVIFCKSYHKDLLRARRMADSVQRFNKDDIPLYISVPSSDLPLFKKTLDGIPCHFLTDEQVLSLTVQEHGPIPELFPSHLLQQLVKLEFWRQGTCLNYMWIDSDAYFLRPFRRDDFFDSQGRLFTIMHHAQDLRTFSENFDPRVLKNLDNMIAKFGVLFGKNPDHLYFGDPPLLWSCKVLESLNNDYLRKKERTIYELLYRYPCEMQLYGEFLLYLQPNHIAPHQPLFKVFHYAEQFFESQRKGESEYSLSKDYFGVIMQSNWTNPKKKQKNDLIRFKRFLQRQKIKVLRSIRL